MMQGETHYANGQPVFGMRAKRSPISSRSGSRRPEAPRSSAITNTRAVEKILMSIAPASTAAGRDPSRQGAQGRRSPSGSPSGSIRSISACVSRHMGTAVANRVRPAGVSFIRRARRSRESIATSTNPRRSSGFSAAVSVVRSMARNLAMALIVGGSGRLSDIISENWPLVRPSGLNASSNRLASARAARWACRHRQ
jgi:hypothetical protein